MINSSDVLIVVVVLYFVECIRKTRPDELIIERARLSGFKLRIPACYPSNGEWGWILLNPLRPNGPVFSVLSPGYALTQRGVLVLRGRLSDATFIAYEDCRTVSVEKGADVSLPSATGALTASPSAERQFTKLLRQLSSMPENERAERLNHVARKRFDLEGIKKECEKLHQLTFSLRRVIVALFLLSFVLFPGSVLLFGLRGPILAFTPFILSCSVVSAIHYYKLTTLLNPGKHKVDVFGTAIRLALYPISAMRCMELLSAEVLVDYDPVAIVMALCGKEGALKLVIKHLAILRYSTLPSDRETALVEALKEYRESRLRLLHSFISEQDLEVPDAIGAPAATDRSAKTYCPSCSAAYTLSEGLCSDCPDIILQRVMSTGEAKEMGLVG